MSLEDIEALEKLERAATPGGDWAAEEGSPMMYDEDPGNYLGDMACAADAELVCALRNAAPVLLELAKRSAQVPQGFGSLPLAPEPPGSSTPGIREQRSQLLAKLGPDWLSGPRGSDSGKTPSPGSPRIDPDGAP